MVGDITKSKITHIVNHHEYGRELMTTQADMQSSRHALDRDTVVGTAKYLYGRPREPQ